MIIFFVLYILLLKYIYFTISKEDFTLDFLRFFTYQDAEWPKLALSMVLGVPGHLMFKTCPGRARSLNVQNLPYPGCVKIQN